MVINLRPELRILSGPPFPGGAPSWTIHDPVRQRFFRIGWLERLVLDDLHLSADAFIQRLTASGGPKITPAQVADVHEFLVQNELVVGTERVLMKALLHRRQQQTHRWLQRLWHGWLFFRIPLWNPEPFLRRLAWLWQILAHPAFQMVLVLLGILGAIHTARHWDAFVATLPRISSDGGWLWYGGAILATKVIHELGHAATAHRLGCRVPVMGVAFVFSWPVFYTDVSEAWLLRSRRDRLAVGAGGMLAELGLAAIASCLWPLLTDGPARSAMVLLAGVAWVGTLVVNLNPFMRFDGYYLLADALGVANLHQQSFQLGRWQLREWLFGWGVSRPGALSRRLATFLTALAYGIWCYRAIVFVGFALLVYFFLFKVAGIILLLAEVGWFLVRPVVMEIKAWWHHRPLFRLNKQVIRTLSLVALFLALVTLVPWEGSVSAPALARAARYQQLFVPVPAVLEKRLVQRDQKVVSGQELMVFAAPDLELALEQNRLKIEQKRWELAHSAREFSVGDNQLVIVRELGSALGEREGLLQQKEQLRVLAPFTGVVRTLAEGLDDGVWVDREQPLLAVMHPEPLRVEAWVDEADINRLNRETRAKFIPADLGLPSLSLRIEQIDYQAVEWLKDPTLASTFGGPLPTRKDKDGRLVAQRGCFRVWLTPVANGSGVKHIIPGTVQFSVVSRTLVETLWHPLWSTLIRQTGF
ncbi:MAG: HlyD family efflux transporter periplasmic adaptor subunit [Magnetococcales bacterium]|nr:HlyD family efflux transporter periplasmic adaptor subunit [Magnetococcales bacterium]